MNILANKTNFVQSFLPTMGTPQKTHFHHAASPLGNFTENNVLHGQNSCRSFKNPNFFNQNTHGQNVPSSYKKIDHVEVRHNDDVAKSPNLSEMVTEKLEKTDFGCGINVDSPKSTTQVSSRKRARKGKHKLKLPDKHNTEREILSEIMDLDVSNDSIDFCHSVDAEDLEMEESLSNPLKICDLIVLPNHSSPLKIPVIDIKMGTSKPIAQTACIALTISPPNTRQRQLSTTESEDSFIVFDSGTDEECDFSDDCGSESDDSSDEEESAESDTDSPESIVPTKKVRFADEKELCEIHPMVQWSFAYQAARKGPWEMYARDRERFKNRIRQVGEKISHCFEPEHRQKMYDQRFKEQMEE
ncbi:hypothetical protein HHI36_021441 [Cryptolaemus montrouzieri]|uniref:Protein DP71L n=1 Tax=Cryptolaemus montrouzieri TaxID=559131 RepID=A0ABD2MWW7_9CUCU